MGIASAIGGIVGGIASNNSAEKAADAQVEAARQQTELEKYIYEDTKGRFEPYYDGGLDYNNALRYELLGGDAPVFGGTPAQITTKTRTDMTRTPGNVVNNVGDHNQWLVDIMNQGSTPGQVTGQSVTDYYVGDNVFSSLEEAQAYANANPVGGTQYQGYEATPGFQFALDQGQAAIDSSAASRGNVFSGATLKAQQEYGTGLAQQEYNNYLNMLMGQSAQGQAAAGNIATAGSNYASGAGSAIGSAGNAQAAGYIAQGNALTGAINNATSAFGYMNNGNNNYLTASNGITVPQSTMNNVQALF
jgi:hypothetical protein